MWKLPPRTGNSRIGRVCVSSAALGLLFLLQIIIMPELSICIDIYNTRHSPARSPTEINHVECDRCGYTRSFSGRAQYTESIIMQINIHPVIRSPKQFFVEFNARFDTTIDVKATTWACDGKIQSHFLSTTQLWSYNLGFDLDPGNRLSP
jgi:hypothetical protein